MVDDIIRTDSMKVDRPTRTFIQSQIYYIKLIYKKHPILFLFFIFFTALSSLISPMTLYLNKETVDILTSFATTNESSQMTWLMILLCCTYILGFLSSYFKEFNEYTFQKIMYSVSYVMKLLLFSKLLQLSIERFEDSSFHDKLKLAQLSLNSGVRVVQTLINLIGVVFSIFGIIGVLLTFHWSLPMTLLLSTLPGITIMFIVKLKGYKAENKASQFEREMYFTEGLFSQKSALKEIKIYNTQQYLMGKWKKLFNTVTELRLKVARWDLRYKSLSLIVLQGAQFGVSLYLVSLVVGAQLSIGSYVALLSSSVMIQGLFGQIGMHMSSLFETAVYNNALLSLIQDAHDDRNDGTYQIRRIESIEMKNVYFSYPNSDVSVLKDISLKIKRGDKISIVGRNGSGKTTLAYCLLGLYRLNAGKLTVNGLDISLLNMESYYNRIAVVFQDFIRYKYSIRENIAFGNLEYLENDKEIYKILDRIELKNKVMDYPGKLETILSKEFMNGTELSGGEWQRIALGRALIKNADVVILDEPTAALDPISELKIFELFHKLYSDKTTISISHRIGPTRLSDLIIVMDDGRIVEQGTFDELMNMRGYYYNMYEAQGKWYKANAVDYPVII
ncbi:MAG: ABC transporter permease [Bacillus thermozeamaize]|uniref:ABC transporter permease n=1 Tax=Bacillus thermozeamaize TaxID=230954 RepID=A0A1Y3PNY6_9BACI|nr:MAG: ABC transporter permease [Bacillus thermozeamaize]